MPEGRMLKKAISDSKSLGKLKSDSARLLYTWLIPQLDVEGRYSADPDLIKGHIFPKIKHIDTELIEEMLLELAGVGLIILYKNDDERYLQLNKFFDHQKLRANREADSKNPAPDDEKSEVIDAYSGVNLEYASTSKVKGSKGKGSKGKEKAENPRSKNSNPSPKKKTETQNPEHIKAFNAFWEVYPKKIAKQYAKEKFMVLARRGFVPELSKAYEGYMDYLKHQKVNNNFNQEPLNPSTFLSKERWRDYIGFEYKARL